MRISKPWFGHKSYGVGLGPKSWEGWACLLAYVLLLYPALAYLPRAIPDPAAGRALGYVAAGFLTVLLLAIVWAKRDRSHRVKWRWGKRAAK